MSESKRSNKLVALPRVGTSRLIARLNRATRVRVPPGVKLLDVVGYEHLISAALVLLLLSIAIVRGVSGAHISSPPTTEKGNLEPNQSGPNYSVFKHDNPNHSRLPCLLCHRRETNSAQPTLPGKAAHAPCAGCHQQQFADSSSPLCTICHTNAQTGTVKSFPPLRSFNLRFDHARHSTVGAACATCHKRSRGGVALSIPSRLAAHVRCFTCHTPGAQSNGRDISSCGTCHQPGRLVRTSENAAAFRVAFSHASHDASEGLRCSDCHKVRAGRQRGRQVTNPVALNHHAPAGAMSCMTCHNGKRAFGGDDFSTCTRCHKGPAWRF